MQYVLPMLITGSDVCAKLGETGENHLKGKRATSSNWESLLAVGFLIQHSVYHRLLLYLLQRHNHLLEIEWVPVLEETDWKQGKD
jgi:hypothetical protein